MLIGYKLVGNEALFFATMASRLVEADEDFIEELKRVILKTR